MPPHATEELAVSHEIVGSEELDLRCPVCLLHDPDYGHMWCECPFAELWRRQFFSGLGPPTLEDTKVPRLWLGRALCETVVH